MKKTDANQIIREARPSDARDIAAVHIRAWQHAYRKLMPRDALDSLDIEKRTEQWQTWLQNGKTLVAESDDTIVGFCSVAKARDDDVDSATGEIYALYVDPRLWRSGIGTHLCDAGLKALWENGFTRAVLWVLRDNLVGRGFYERYGFLADGHEEMLTAGSEQLPELRYAISSAE